MSAVDSILSKFAEGERDKLVPLLKQAPALYERLTGRPRHRCTIWRHACEGVAGIKLRTVSVGKTLMTTARWVVEHWVAVGDARANAKHGSGRKAGGAS